MEPFVILLVIISAIMNVWYNAILKKTINAGGDSVLLFWLSIISSTLLYSIILFLFIGIESLTLLAVFFSAIFGFFLHFISFL